MNNEKRVPVQGAYYLPFGTVGRDPGTITWSEHEEIWQVYMKRWGGSQSAERIAARGGFGYDEIIDLIGHAPKTWQPAGQ